MSDVDVNGNPHPFDTMSDVEFLRKMLEYFGPARFTGLLGWGVVAALVAFPKSARDLRIQLQARGYDKSTLYRTLADIREFGLEVEKQVGWVPSTPVTKTEEIVWSMRLLERIGKSPVNSRNDNTVVL
jgi:hypothetical protein